MKSSNIAIRVENIGKFYRIFEKRRDIVKQLIFRERECYKKNVALKNISFELKRGESIGIVGRNGSGKSTLLQIVCQTLKQSSGEVEINGKIAALLELGSGFNPEFTGRENVYINGILLGLKKSEIKAKMQEILEFAEIGEFIDQPVKTYSSGMVVRLAFAVIANSNADILVIDEALAVGDAYFTQKCMRYIQRFRESGSILFVSHDANAILSLCDRAILIKNGEQRLVGEPKKVMEEYTKEIHIRNKNKNNSNKDKPNPTKKGNQDKKQKNDVEDYKQRWLDYRAKAINRSKMANIIRIEKYNKKTIQRESYGGKEVEIISTEIKNMENDKKNLRYIKGGELVKITIMARVKANISTLIVGFILKNKQGLDILGDNTLNGMIDEESTLFKKGDIFSACFIFAMPLLTAGEYSITSSVAKGSLEEHNILHWQNDALILVSQCTSISAGIAGVPMQSITIERIKNEFT